MYLKKHIHIGEIHLAKEPTEISTVLGSCIAVCLYDSRLKIGAMNHYLSPLWNENGLQTPKYGNISIPKLVERMIKAGSSFETMEAKVFGGANMIEVKQEFMMVGRKNRLVAKEILQEYGIKISAHDVAGNKGRKIMMQSDTGKIFLKYTQKGA